MSTQAFKSIRSSGGTTVSLDSAPFPASASVGFQASAPCGPVRTCFGDVPSTNLGFGVVWTRQSQTDLCAYSRFAFRPWNLREAYYSSDCFLQNRRLQMSKIPVVFLSSALVNFRPGSLTQILLEDFSS